MVLFFFFFVIGDNKKVSLKLKFDQVNEEGDNKSQYLSVLELSSLMYDFNLLHDCVVLLSKEYGNYKFSEDFWLREGRPLRKQDQLYTRSVNYSSPLVLEVIVGSVTVAWILMQAIDKIRSWKLEDENKKLENKKLRKELGENSNLKEEKDLEKLIKERGAAEKVINEIINRLEERSLFAVAIEITINFEDNTKDNKD